MWSKTDYKRITSEACNAAQCLFLLSSWTFTIARGQERAFSLSYWSYETVSKDIVFKCCWIWVAARHGWSRVASIVLWQDDPQTLILHRQNSVSLLIMRHRICISKNQYQWKVDFEITPHLPTLEVIAEPTLNPFSSYRRFHHE